MKTPINYCASYQDLTSSNGMCAMKRDSCILNKSDSDQIQQLNQQTNQNQPSSANYERTTYENGFKQSDNNQQPPDTGKQSESTVEIERIIEKNTTDQV